MTDTSHDIRTLNGLIATTIDSVDGYRSSAEAVDSPRFAGIVHRPRQRALVGRRTASRRSSSPGRQSRGRRHPPRQRPPRLSQPQGGGDRPRDDKAIVNEVERGEDHIKAKYEAALADDSCRPKRRI